MNYHMGALVVTSEQADAQVTAFWDAVDHTRKLDYVVGFQELHNYIYDYVSQCALDVREVVERLFMEYMGARAETNYRIAAH
jgi:hypothetical protein